MTKQVFWSANSIGQEKTPFLSEVQRTPELAIRFFLDSLNVEKQDYPDFVNLYGYEYEVLTYPKNSLPVQIFHQKVCVKGLKGLQ